jgi:CRISPR-associated endoribonuclease Cas6
MVLNLEMKVDELTLPVNYNHILQAVILKWINDENYKNFLHDKGFTCRDRVFKLFTFSRIYGEKKFFNSQNNTLTFYEKIKLKIAGLDDYFLENIVKTYFFEDYFEISNKKIYLDSIKGEKIENKKNKIIVKTLSPVTIYSTVEIHDKKKTYYYHPSEVEFSVLLKNNLIKKYESFYGKKIENAEFKVLKHKNLKQSVVRYKNFIIKGWNGIFELQGSPELLNIALNAGLGGKNSQGFGFVQEAV